MLNKKIILDTETTGLSANNGDKIVEIACIELLNDKDFGASFHYYINPERHIPIESTNIHGITNDKVADCKKFVEIYEELIEFIGDSQIIAHNAEFDRGFINAEFRHINKAEIPKSKFIDTLTMAREKFPREKVSLDHLCNKFNISLESRKDYHGALIDIVLLGEVYLNLIKGQSNIFDDNKLEKNNLEEKIEQIVYENTNFIKREVLIQANEELKHKDFINSKIKNATWFK